MKLQIFNGGLNTRQSAHLLNVAEAVEYSNVDNEASSLKPLKDKATSGLTMDKFAYYFDAQSVWEASELLQHYLEYQDNLYYTIINEVPKYFDGTTHYLLGIANAITALIVSDGVAGNLTGTYNYVIVFYNSTKGIESEQSPISLDVVASAQQVDVTSIPVSTDPQVDEKRIYRVGGNITIFSLVATIPNADTSYVDDTADINIPGNAMDVTNNDQAPAGAKYLTEAYGIMFAVLGNKLYYSRTGQFTYWPAVNFINFPVEITGIAAAPIGILVYTNRKTYIITGSSPGSFTKRIFDGDQGCIGHDSIAAARGSIIWASADGICTIVGSKVEVISLEKLGIITLEVTNAVFHNKVYYLLQTNGTILAYDFRYGVLLKELELSVTRLLVGQDKVYGYKDGVYYELFAGTSDLTYTYKSPKLSDGSLVLRKIYKSILINSSGNVAISVLIDGIERANKSYSTDDTHEIKVDEQYKNGYSIQFIITGTGIVNEIDYTVGAFKK